MHPSCRKGDRSSPCSFHHCLLHIEGILPALHADYSITTLTHTHISSRQLIYCFFVPFMISLNITTDSWGEDKRVCIPLTLYIAACPAERGTRGLMAVKHGPCLLTLKKGARHRNQVPEETSRHTICSARSTTGCGARSTSLWVHRSFFW